MGIRLITGDAPTRRVRPRKTQSPAEPRSPPRPSSAIANRCRLIRPGVARDRTGVLPDHRQLARLRGLAAEEDTFWAIRAAKQLNSRASWRRTPLKSAVVKTWLASGAVVKTSASKLLIFFDPQTEKWPQSFANLATFAAVSLRRRSQGQTYPAPLGALKQPTDSGNTCSGNHRIAFGTKIVKAIVAKNTT
jgi:hypothetical protein